LKVLGDEEEAVWELRSLMENGDFVESVPTFILDISNVEQTPSGAKVES
jgi:hypothetical protein